MATRSGGWSRSRHHQLHTVTNLPPEVTGQNWPNVLFGTEFALRLPDGRIATTGWGVTGVQHPLFLLTLNGSTVVNTVRYDLGIITVVNGAAPQAALLPDGRILIAVHSLNGALGGTLLGIVDPNLPPTAPGAITPIPVSWIPAGTNNAMAFDAATGTAYVALTTCASTSIYRISVPGGGVPSFVVAVPMVVNALEFDSQGRLLIGRATCNMATGPGMYCYANGRLTTFPQLSGQLVNAVREDPVTGDLYIATFSLATATTMTSTLHRLSPPTPTGTLTTLTSGPAGGWGVLSGIDLAPNPESYGTASGAATTAEWLLAPNAGGTPTVGNASFGLQLDIAPTPAVNGVLLSAGQVSPFTFMSLQILIDPSLASSWLVPGGNPVSVPLPIPNNPGLQGTQWFLQTVHALNASSLAASPGVRFTLW